MKWNEKSPIIQHGWNWMEDPKRLGKFSLLWPCIYFDYDEVTAVPARAIFLYLLTPRFDELVLVDISLETFRLFFIFSLHELCHTITPAQINHWLAMSSAYYHHFCYTFRFKWKRAKQKLRLLLFSSAIILYGFSGFPPSLFANKEERHTRSQRANLCSKKRNGELNFITKNFSRFSRHTITLTLWRWCLAISRRAL